MEHIRHPGSLRLLITLGLAGVLSTGSGAVGAETPMASPLPLRPEQMYPLQGTTWRLQSYSRRGSQRHSGPEVAAWVQLRGGRLVGSGGCTGIHGSYASMGAALMVKMAKTRKPSCAEQTSLVQLGLIEGLVAAASYELVAGATPRDTRMVMRDRDGDSVLTFGVDDAGPLEPGEWRLEAYTSSGQRVAADATLPAVLTFQPGRSNKGRRRSSGELLGSTGCNGIVGDYQRQADVLSVGRLKATDAPCSPALEAQETAMLEILDATSLSIRLPPDRLILASDESGEQLELARSRGLEDGAWLLNKVATSPRSSETVTLRLRGGEVSGEGPCGPYGGRYLTDGVFIGFALLQGAGDDTCDDRRAERHLLDALRKAVLVDRRDDGNLRLRDAAGKELARFDRLGGP